MAHICRRHGEKQSQKIGYFKATDLTHLPQPIQDTSSCTDKIFKPGKAREQLNIGKAHNESAKLGR